MSKELDNNKQHWDETIISNVATVIVGGTPSTNAPLFWGGNIPWMASGDIHLQHIYDVSGRITELGLKCSNAVIVEPKAIAMALAGQGKTRGTVAITHIPICTNQSVALIKTQTNKLDPDFLYQALVIRYEEMRSRSSGGGRGGLTKAIIEGIPILLPPLPQQHKIAKILTTIDNLIEKTESLIAKYQSIKQGMMHDLFTKGVDAKGKLRPPQSEDMNDDLKLKDWRTVRLSEVTVKIADRDHYTPTYTTEGVIIVSPKDFDKNGQIDFSNCQFVSETEHLRNRRKTDIKASDLIFTRIGARLGKACLVTPKMPEFSLLHSAVMIRVALEHLDPLYFLYVLKGQEIQGQIVKEIQSIGVPDLGLDKINAFRISIPPLPQQRKIAEILSKHDQLIEDHQNELLKYKNLKTALMQDLLTGKVQVTPDAEDKELAHA